ncbi:hypothetical protein LTR08_002821 [Meristemomyces frigidus]|nr:hypothetical protein LTR08_002821 [Meristemomyces frigidus]
MSVYSFYIFDRHTECIYTKRWLTTHAPPTPRPQSKDPLTAPLPSAQRQALKQLDDTKLIFGTIFSLRRLCAQLGSPHPSATTTTNPNPPTPTNNTNTITPDTPPPAPNPHAPPNDFLSYRTGEYKLHYFETPTALKFVLFTDLRVGSMRTVLYQIWASLYVEFVVKSPLVVGDSEGRGVGGRQGGKGVGNELFEGGLERFIESIFAPQPA